MSLGVNRLKCYIQTVILCYEVLVGLQAALCGAYKKVKGSPNWSGVAQRVPGGLGSQISMICGT